MESDIDINDSDGDDIFDPTWRPTEKGESDEDSSDIDAGDAEVGSGDAEVGSDDAEVDSDAVSYTHLTLPTIYSV